MLQFLLRASSDVIIKRSMWKEDNATGNVITYTDLTLSISNNDIGYNL